MTPTVLERYRRSFVDTWTDDTPTDQVRFVVLDSETTGLDPRNDRVITLGAIAVRNREILLDDAFDVLIKIARNTSAVTVHGITRDESQNGLDEEDALMRFLDYLQDGVFVGHHIGHDVSTLNAACSRYWDLQLMNRTMDTMDLALHLERDGAFEGVQAIQEFTLDALCRRFGVVPHDRHTAGGDAFLTAQIFLRLLKPAARHGRTTLATICEPFVVGA